MYTLKDIKNRRYKVLLRYHVDRKLNWDKADLIQLVEDTIKFHDQKFLYLLHTAMSDCAPINQLYLKRFNADYIDFAEFENRVAEHPDRYTEDVHRGVELLRELIMPKGKVAKCTTDNS